MRGEGPAVTVSEQKSGSGPSESRLGRQIYQAGIRRVFDRTGTPSRSGNDCIASNVSLFEAVQAYDGQRRAVQRCLVVSNPHSTFCIRPVTRTGDSRIYQ